MCIALIDDTGTAPVALHLDVLHAAAYESSTTTMFKSAATKLAHSSTIRAVAQGNSDLRPLQEAITTEKLVMQSYVYSATPTIQVLISRF